jgi:hypothetical protein
MNLEDLKKAVPGIEKAVQSYRRNCASGGCLEAGRPVTDCRDKSLPA